MLEVWQRLWFVDRFCGRVSVDSGSRSVSIGGRRRVHSDRRVHVEWKRVVHVRLRNRDHGIRHWERHRKCDGRRFDGCRRDRRGRDRCRLNRQLVNERRLDVSPDGQRFQFLDLGWKESGSARNASESQRIERIVEHGFVEHRFIEHGFVEHGCVQHRQRDRLDR